MKACWDIINNMKYYQDKNIWTMNRRSYHLSESCPVCGDPFFYLVYNKGKYCSKSCNQNGKNNSFYGKIHTEEYKQFISDINSGRIFSKETRLNMSKAMKGIPKSEEHKKKISERMSGENHPFYGKKRPEHSKKISGKNNYLYGKGYLISGEKNPNWKGGISFLPYCIDWMKDFKEIIKHRDGYKCSNFLCYNSSDENDLTIHHIDYNKLNCSIDNLITVCRSCNGKANKDRGWHTSFYTELLKGRI